MFCLGIYLHLLNLFFIVIIICILLMNVFNRIFFSSGLVQNLCHRVKKHSNLCQTFLFDQLMTSICLLLILVFRGYYYQIYLVALYLEKNRKKVHVFIGFLNTARCFIFYSFIHFRLYLPLYSRKRILKTKLLMAIKTTNFGFV